MVNFQRASRVGFGMPTGSPVTGANNPNSETSNLPITRGGGWLAETSMVSRFFTIDKFRIPASQKYLMNSRERIAGTNVANARASFVA